MSIPTPEELIGRAREMIPAMETRAATTEALGRLPDESLRDFREAGFFKVVQPKRYGGYEMSLMVLFDISVQLGQGCVSSAWVHSILSIHQFYLSFFHPRAQDDVWKERPETLVSTPFRPSGTTTREKGGVRIRNGRWTFASGVDHADWALVGILAPGDAGVPQYLMAVVPMQDIVIDHESWHVMGLKGTGSKDLTIEDAFVPEHRLFDLIKAGNGEGAPGLEVNTSWVYQLPFFGSSINSLVAPAVGGALGAIKRYKERLGARVLAFSEVKQVEQAPAQIRLAVAAGEVDAAELLIKRDYQLMKDRVAQGRSFSMEERARFRFNNALTTRLATNAVDRVFEGAGGGALQEDEALQRHWRDVRAINNHAGMNLDTTAENFARIMLGMPSKDVIL